MATILLMSSTAQSNECVSAVSVKLNQPSPCSGLLISDEQAKSCIKCKNIQVPTLEELIKGCNKKNQVLVELNEKLEKRATDLIKINKSQYDFTTVILVAVSAFAVGSAVGLFAVTVN